MISWRTYYIYAPLACIGGGEMWEGRRGEKIEFMKDFNFCVVGNTENHSAHSNVKEAGGTKSAVFAGVLFLQYLNFFKFFYMFYMLELELG